MIGVWKHELRQYFLTAVGYVFVTIFWLLSAVFFFLYNIMSGTADLSKLFGNLSYLIMLIVPLLTMRLISAERSQKTDQLLYCAPISLGEVVMGKFMAAMSVLLIALAGTAVYIGILAHYTDLAIGPVVSCYLGFFLLSGCYVSVGMLMSALAESQITAAVLTFAANMILQLVEMWAPSLHVPYLSFLPELLGVFTLNERYAEFVRGVFSPVDLGYFLLFAALALLTTVIVMNRRQMKKR